MGLGLMMVEMEEAVLAGMMAGGCEIAKSLRALKSAIVLLWHSHHDLLSVKSVVWEDEVRVGVYSGRRG